MNEWISIISYMYIYNVIKVEVLSKVTTKETWNLEHHESESKDEEISIKKKNVQWTCI